MLTAQSKTHCVQESLDLDVGGARVCAKRDVAGPAKVLAGEPQERCLNAKEMYVKIVSCILGSLFVCCFIVLGRIAVRGSSELQNKLPYILGNKPAGNGNNQDVACSGK